MVARYKKSIYMLAELIRELEANPDNYALLLRLQRLLVDRIRRTDGRVVALKQRRRALNQQKKTGMSKAASQAIKKQIASVSEGISEAQRLLFIWRCFGDGIAFIYLDKYALKHMLYNTHEYTMKESAGALLDKAGVRLEWSIVRRFAQRKIPAVLCDITNTLRHGDVCVLVGPDPIPIEVKSSKNWNARVDRQVASLEALRRFFTSDEAKDFRGLDSVKRLELPMLEVNHVKAMNECIERSRATGFAAISPEDGLTYACLGSVQAVDQLEEYMRPESMLTLLNDAKRDSIWMPYYPFTLSIREPQALYEFINGDITLAVILHIPTVIRVFAENGLQPSSSNLQN